MSDENTKQRLLIANRGEIAVRVARTARCMGFETVAVCSELERGALHTQVCDYAIVIEDENPRAAYMNIERLEDIAKEWGCTAVHPGYGFLAENADFAGRSKRGRAWRTRACP